MKPTASIHTETHRTISILTVFFLLLSTALLFPGCEGSTDPGFDDNNDNTNGNGTTPPPSGPEDDEVWMGAISFNPSSRTVTVGTTITWTNTSDVNHTVTSGSGGSPDGLFDSGTLSPDQTFSYTFDEVGNYPYYCIPHVDMGMTGTVTVVAEEEASAETEDDEETGTGGTY
ncbi:MAG: plastocyanin/azurin family copper-binding protein [Balneolaceae bacterium]